MIVTNTGSIYEAQNPLRHMHIRLQKSLMLT